MINVNIIKSKILKYRKFRISEEYDKIMGNQNKKAEDSVQVKLSVPQDVLSNPDMKKESSINLMKITNKALVICFQVRYYKKYTL